VSGEKQGGLNGKTYPVRRGGGWGNNKKKQDEDGIEGFTERRGKAVSQKEMGRKRT